eukprot:Tbor_TRINITY_DN5303_c7_g1::TRINITY_DN5303_c7_g1_i3::g.4017::m.4017/K03671/trxA; thioredoxin 1
MPSLIDIYTTEQFEEYVNSPTPTVIIFSAEWCTPCKIITREIINKIIYEFPNIIFIKVDADNNSDILAKCQIKALPTFLLVINGKECGYLIGGDGGMLRGKIRSAFLL